MNIFPEVKVYLQQNLFVRLMEVFMNSVSLFEIYIL